MYILRHRQQHGGIVRLPLRRELSHLLNERPVRVASQGFAQGDGRGGAGIRLQSWTSASIGSGMRAGGA